MSNIVTGQGGNSADLYRFKKFVTCVSVKFPGIKILGTIVSHFVFWFIVWLFYRYFFSYNSGNPAYVTWFSTLLLPLTIGVTYFMVYNLIPRYLLKKEYYKFGLYSFYLFVFTSYFIALIIYGCLVFILDMEIDRMPPMSKNFLFILILIFMVVGMVSTITILSHNSHIISRNKELQNKILAAQLELKEQELQYLKSQIHPHFLFNTLNTIYGLAIAQSKQTPELILRLSNLLDYILYQVNKPRVRLCEEVQHITEYLELEKVRFNDTLKVSFKKDHISEDIEIAPMLLIPLVENAFKHGSPVKGILTVDMILGIEDHKLTYTVRNSYRGTENSTGGLGLENIHKRLDLHYPGNYLLVIDPGMDIFSVTLTINDLLQTSNA